MTTITHKNRFWSLLPGCLFLGAAILAPIASTPAVAQDPGGYSDGDISVPIPTDPDIRAPQNDFPPEIGPDPTSDYPTELPTYGDAGTAAEPAPPPDDLMPLPAPTVPATSPAPIDLAKKVVLIGRPPFISVKEMLVLVKGLTGFLKKEMGVKDVRVVTAKNYSGVLDALARGTIDFAWLGPTSYVIAAAQTPLIPLAQAKRRTGASYHGVFITRGDSKILGLDDIKGKTIGFVDPESASGYLYPLFFLKRAGINPAKHCRKVEFLWKHDAVLAAVLARRIDVGVCLEDNVANIRDKKILDQLLVLGKTDEVPSDVVGCRADCHPTLREAFQKALLMTSTLKQPTGGPAGSPPIMQFMPVDEAGIDSVRNVLREIKDLRRN